VTTTAYRTVTNFTATAGQTSFSVPSYTIGYIDVYRNGVRLVSTDFTATTGTTVVLVNACTVNDAVVTESFYVSSVLNAIPATAGAVNSTYLADGAVTQAKLGTGVAGNGPAFSANTVTAQSFSSSTFTKVQINVEAFDTNSNYDPTTNYRFTPTVAGYYQINANVAFAGSAVGYVQVALYKNGAQFIGGSGIPNNTSVGGMAMVSSVISFNGSTDYVEFYAWQSSGGALALQTGVGANTFSGAMVRNA
jgi:hypothetical protein